MKLRFRANSLRLRLNQKEVKMLLAGEPLREQIQFPGAATLAYVLAEGLTAEASFEQGAIRVQVPRSELTDWARGDEMGMYFDFETDGSQLRVAIEKDLECVDGPPEELDLDAFPRTVKAC